MLMLPSDRLRIWICFGIAAFLASSAIGLFWLFHPSTGLSLVCGSGAGCCRWEALTPAGSSCTLHCAITRGRHSTFGFQSTGLACLTYTSVPLLAFGFTSLASCTGSATFLCCTRAFSICIQSCGEPPDILLAVILLTTVRGHLLCCLFWFFWWHGKSEEQAQQITYYTPESTLFTLTTLSCSLTTSERHREIWQCPKREMATWYNFITPPELPLTLFRIQVFPPSNGGCIREQRQQIALFSVNVGLTFIFPSWNYVLPPDEEHVQQEHVYVLFLMHWDLELILNCCVVLTNAEATSSGLFIIHCRRQHQAVRKLPRPCNLCQVYLLNGMPPQTFMPRQQRKPMHQH